MKDIRIIPPKRRHVGPSKAQAAGASASLKKFHPIPPRKPKDDK